MLLQKEKKQHRKKNALSGVGFEPTPSYEDQNTHTPIRGKILS